jgi:hypothetical protein
MERERGAPTSQGCDRDDRNGMKGLGKVDDGPSRRRGRMSGAYGARNLSISRRPYECMGADRIKNG